MTPHPVNRIGQFAQLQQLVIGCLQDLVTGVVPVVVIDPGQIGQVDQHQAQVRLVSPGLGNSAAQPLDKLVSLDTRQLLQVRTAFRV